MKSSAQTVEEYLKELPPDRAEAISKVRQVILKNLPKGYEEAMNWGMISYQVPLEVYPDTYNKQPLMYAALGSQKNYMAIYTMGSYGSPKLRKQLEDGFKIAGKKLEMGQSCIRFKKLDELPLDTIGRIIAGLPMNEYIAHAKSIRSK